jgi:hypothetical protein
MSSILLRLSTRYLERVPATGDWRWLAPFPKFASRFTADQAALMLTRFGAGRSVVALITSDAEPTVEDAQVTHGEIEPIVLPSAVDDAAHVLERR